MAETDKNLDAPLDQRVPEVMYEKIDGRIEPVEVYAPKEDNEFFQDIVDDMYEKLTDEEKEVLEDGNEFLNPINQKPLLAETVIRTSMSAIDDDSKLRSLIVNVIEKVMAGKLITGWYNDDDYVLAVAKSINKNYKDYSIEKVSKTITQLYRKR